jgi:hypothetical protein
MTVATVRLWAAGGGDSADALWGVTGALSSAATAVVLSAAGGAAGESLGELPTAAPERFAPGALLAAAARRASLPLASATFRDQTQDVHSGRAASRAAPVAPQAHAHARAEAAGSAERRTDARRSIVQTNEERATTARLNVVLIGARGVGKSSLAAQLAVSGTTSTGLASSLLFRSDMHTVRLEVDRICCAKVHIWDPDGAALDSAGALLDGYLRAAHVVLLVYDCSDRATFAEVPRWLARLRDAQRTPRRLCVHLVCNKVDLKWQRRVSLHEALALARQLGVSLIETAAAGPPSTMLHDVFARVVCAALERGAALSQDELLADTAAPTLRPSQARRTRGEGEQRGWLGGLSGGSSDKAGRASMAAASTAARLGRGASAIDAVQLVVALAAVAARDAARQLELERPRAPGPGEALCPLRCGAILPSITTALVEHAERECPLRRAPCPLGCGERMQVGEHARHVRESCLLRVAPCRICLEIVQASQQGVHAAHWAMTPSSGWVAGDAAHWVHGALPAGRVAALHAEDLAHALEAFPVAAARAKLAQILGVDLAVVDSELAAHDASLKSRAASNRAIAARSDFVLGEVPVRTTGSAERTSKAAEKRDQEGDKAPEAMPLSHPKQQQPIALLAAIRGGVELAGAASTVLGSVSPAQGPGPPAAPLTQQQQPRDALLLAVKGFDRSKLSTKDGASSGVGDVGATRLGEPTRAADRGAEAGSGAAACGANAMVAGIATFDRGKLRKATASAPRPKPGPTPSLLASVAAALAKRREALEEEDDKQHAASGWE